MRRHLPPELWSQNALWSRRAAALAAIVAILAVLLGRARVIEPPAALLALGAAMALALTALLLVCAAAYVIWVYGRRGTGAATAGLFIALLTLAWPAFLSYQAVTLPVLSDISTDVVDPPFFSFSSAAYAARKGFQPPGLPQRARAAQRLAYPEVGPIVVDLDADEAFALVLKTAQASGWKTIDSRPPGGGRTGEGHIDFIDRTLIMGFDDDVTVRLRPLPGQTRIDIRSASRYGRHDFGANARRIVAFAEELQAQLNSR